MVFNLFNKAKTTQTHEITLPESSPADAAPPIGITPPRVLIQEAAAGRRGAAWRLLLRLMEDDPWVIAAIASFEDGRLAQHLLEFIALGTWAGQPFVVPAPLRSPYARLRLRTLFRPGGGIESQRAEHVLTAALRDCRPAIRMTAASLLGSMGSATATPELIESLHDPVPAVQRESAKALGYTRNPAAVPALLSLLQRADEQLGKQIFSTLVRLGPAAVPALVESSASNSPWMRWHCIHALGNMRDLRALPVLVRALSDADQSVAWMAAKGLVPFGRESVGPVLRLLMSTPVTPWLVETSSYVLSNQRNPKLKPYLEPLLQHMHEVGFQVGTILYAQRALSRLITDGLIETGGQQLRAKQTAAPSRSTIAPAKKRDRS